MTWANAEIGVGVQRCPTVRESASMETVVAGRTFSEDLAAAHEAPFRRMRELRDLGGPRVGFPDEFYRLAADVVRGKPHPVTWLAKRLDVEISTASRWLTKAEQRGYLPQKSYKDYWSARVLNA